MSSPDFSGHDGGRRGLGLLRTAAATQSGAPEIVEEGRHLQRSQVSHEVPLLVRAEMRLQHDVEELDRVLERQQPADEATAADELEQAARRVWSSGRRGAYGFNPPRCLPLRHSSMSAGWFLPRLCLRSRSSVGTNDALREPQRSHGED